VAWFAVAPENMPISNQKPEGFDAFWQKNLDELHAINPNYKLEKVESLCSETRDGYTVEMKSLGNLTIRGYYFVPKTGSKHPAILHLPGYSYGFEHLDGFKNRKGDCAELAICVRGHGISKDVFNPWDSITLWAVGICNRDSYIYRSIFMDGVRALEFLASQPNIDTKRIGVAGGSQGGGLTLAVAAMCPSLVAGCAFFDPWLCDFDNQRRIRTLVDEELEQFMGYPSVRCSTNHMLSVLDYFDTKHFASAIKCPAYFLTALFDDDCPPRCGFSAFNSLKTKKEYIVFPNDSHLGESGEYDNLSNYLETLLSNKK
jgi:cephalosporin-C deacetylase-like acetyl esterase